MVTTSKLMTTFSHVYYHNTNYTSLFEFFSMVMKKLVNANNMKIPHIHPINTIKSMPKSFHHNYFDQYHHKPSHDTQ